MSSDPYSQAFGNAKAEIQKNEEKSQSDKEEVRAKWQDEAKADSDKLKEIVQPELHRAADALKKMGGRIETGGSVHADRNNAPASIYFRVLDEGDWGRTSLFYNVRPQQGMVTVERANTMDVFNNRRKSEVVSEKFGIKTREDLTSENMQKLILAAIEEYKMAKSQKL